MQTRRVGGRTYTDPDVVALIDRHGGELDPYAAVRAAVEDLLRGFDSFEADFDDALERIRALASLAGFKVKSMDSVRAQKETREAVIIPTDSPDHRGIILYNPLRLQTRIIHSIAHEIVHSLLPNSGNGARFRSLCREGSGPARELESLCEYGAAHLTMPERRIRPLVRRFGLGLDAIDDIRKAFGTSYQATLYRVIDAADANVACGLFCFRRRLSEEPRRAAGLLPFSGRSPHDGAPPRKYRRQSFHTSRTYPRELLMPWNKSLADDSCTYLAAQTGERQRVTENVPLGSRGSAVECLVEAMPAPYQPLDASPDWPDMVVLIQPAM